MRTLFFTLIASLAGSLSGVHAADLSTRLLTSGFLIGLRQEISSQHPTILGAAARIAAAQAAVRTVRLWEDPMVGFGYMSGDEELVADDGDLGFGVEIPLPRFGLVKARRAKAQAEVFLAESSREQVLIELQRVAALSAIEIALYDDLVSIEGLEQEWLEKMAATALEKSKDPMANASEVLRFESESARQQQKIETYKLQRAQLAEQLNLILGRQGEKGWEMLRLSSESEPIPSAEALREGLVRNPLVRKAEASAQIADRDVEIAKAESSPALAVVADSSFYSGSGYRQTTVGVQVSLPWFNEPSYRASRQSAAVAAGAARHEADGVLRDVEFEAVAARTQAQSAFQTARRFQKDVIPRMAKAMESTESAWVSSRASVIDVLDARRSLLAARVEEKRAQAEGLASLERLRALSPGAFSQ
jgi:outer membrane protein TolC